MNPIQNIAPHQRQEFMRTLEELQVKDSLMCVDVELTRGGRTMV